MQFTRRLVNNDLFSFSICWLLAPNCLVCLTTRRYNDTYLRAHHHSNLIKFDYDEALLCKYRNWHANRNKDNNDYFVAIFLSSINLRFIGDARSVLIPAFVKWYSKVNLVHMNYKSQLNYHCAFDVTNSQYTAWRTFSKVDIHLMSACARASNRISILSPKPFVEAKTIKPDYCACARSFNIPITTRFMICFEHFIAHCLS